MLAAPLSRRSVSGRPRWPARARPYQGRFEQSPVEPLDDPAAAAAEMCRRFGY